METVLAETKPDKTKASDKKQNKTLFAVRISLLLFTFVFKIFTDPGLHKIRDSSLVCRCGFAFRSSFCKIHYGHSRYEHASFLGHPPVLALGKENVTK